MVELPMRHPELFRRLGIAPPRGVLLLGPPGTGKTLIAKATANEVDASFFPVSGPETVSKYYGESEQHLREIFDEAQRNAPAIVFIDEIDSIAPSREEVTGETERRIVAQLLALMDGLEERGDVIVIAATNRPDIVDRALLRPGRLEKVIYVPVPDLEARTEILRVHTRDMPLADDVDLDALARDTDGYTGGDIEAVAREASMLTMDEIVAAIEGDDRDPAARTGAIPDDVHIERAHFEQALRKVKPSVTDETLEFYENLTDELGGVTPDTVDDSRIGYH